MPSLNEESAAEGGWSSCELAERGRIPARIQEAKMLLECGAQIRGLPRGAECTLGPPRD